jgi:hypothetical protein
MSSRNDSVAQPSEAVEQQIVANILRLHLQIESLEAAVAELRRRLQQPAASRKREI